MTPEEKTELSVIINDNLRSYKRGAAEWSFIHHLFTWGAAVLSAATAAVIQLKLGWGNLNSDTLATLLAAAAAITTTIAASGAFRRKWRTNRLTRSSFEQLKTEMTNPSVDGNQIRELINKALAAHHIGIIGPDE